MTITVTQEDIDKGVISSCVACPIALAVGRFMPDSGFIVCANAIDFTSPLGDLIHLPIEAVKFISDFDKGRPVQPFTFELE